MQLLFPVFLLSTFPGLVLAGMAEEGGTFMVMMGGASPPYGEDGPPDSVSTGSGGGMGNGVSIGEGASSAGGEGGGSASVNAKPPPASSSGGGGGDEGGDDNCFSGDAILTTPSGPKAMRELKEKDMVAVLSKEGLRFEPVLYFQHKNPNKVIPYHLVELESGEKLKISGEHLIHLHSGPDCARDPGPPAADEKENGKFKLASRLEGVKDGEEMCLARVSAGGSLAHERVISVSKVPATGVYAPVTPSGTLLVNNILASCFTHFESQGLHIVGHSYFGRLFGQISDYPSLVKAEARKSGDVRPALALLREMTKASLPTNA